jgi:hypothetical protein
MNELSTMEIEQVSGANLIRIVCASARYISKGLYNSGMNAYNSGAGDTYLLAVSGGNFGA